MKKESFQAGYYNQYELLEGGTSHKLNHSNKQSSKPLPEHVTYQKDK